MKSLLLFITFLSTFTTKIDSLVAVLPQLSDSEKLNTLNTLTQLTSGLPAQKHYTYQYLYEARRQKNVEAESAALVKLTLLYYPQFDSDSIFTIGEEAVRFSRLHKQYDNLFLAQSELIRRYKAQGNYLIALRRAEETLAEAKELKEERFMGRMLSAIGGIMYNLEQYEEAINHWKESIRLMAPYRQAPNELFLLQHYDFMVMTLSYLNRPEESLSYADSMQTELNRLVHIMPDYNFQRYRFYIAYHHAMAYADMKQPERALEAIRQAEAVFDPLWVKVNPVFAAQIDNLYAEYYRATGNYNKALELFLRILRLDEEANREASVVMWKQHIAQVYREKGDYKAAADMYSEVIKMREELNKQKYYAQLNELRTIYELDKTERESERRLASLRHQRLVIGGLLLACVALAIILGLITWSRRRIAQKNRGLYLQIKEQDRLRQLMEVQAAGTQEVQEDDLFFKRLTLLMKEQRLYVKSEISRNDIAKQIGLSDRRLHDCVKNNTGMGFAEYINTLRLSHSRELLSGSDQNMTIEAIAFDSGFSSRATFYRLFYEKYGLSPQEFRKFVHEVA